MKCRGDRNRAIATICAFGLSKIDVLAKALHYIRAACHDKRNGFPYTAAMEWRNAAELFSPSTLASEYCWRNWEHIMRLPRRLAGPVSVSTTLKPASAPLPAMKSMTDQVSLAIAA